MRYFLNIRTKDSLVIDDEGDEFASVAQLFDHAKRVALELEREYPRDMDDVWGVVPVAVEVADELGALVLRLSLHQCSCSIS
jgi:hypothetical protein